MKKLLLLITLFYSVIFFGQNSEPVKYSEVVQVPDLSEKNLYTNVKIWFAEVYKNPKSVILVDDKDANIITGRATMKYSDGIFNGGLGREGLISYDIKISIKEGRYKYDFENFYHKGNNIHLGLITSAPMLPDLRGPDKFRVKVSDKARAIIDENMTFLIEKLKIQMSKNPIESENW